MCLQLTLPKLHFGTLLSSLIHNKTMHNNTYVNPDCKVRLHCYSGEALVHISKQIPVLVFGHKNKSPLHKLWLNLQSSSSPCSFWFSFSILSSRICCRMAFLHSSLSSSLLFLAASSGTAFMIESPLPPHICPTLSRLPSRQGSTSSETHIRL